MAGTLVSEKEKTKEYRYAVEALLALPNHLRGRAFAEATSLAIWEALKRLGLKRTNGYPCLSRLLGRQCTHVGGNPPDPDRPHCVPRADHVELLTRDGKPTAYLSQPYGLSLADAAATHRLCAPLGLEGRVNTWPAPHYPGAVLSVCIMRKGERLNKDHE
jgi:hypothetical protein